MAGVRHSIEINDMSEEKGIRWWLRFVVVPILVGGGVIGYILNLQNSELNEDSCFQYREIEGIWADDNQLPVFQIMIGPSCNVDIKYLNQGYRGDYKGISYEGKVLRYTRFRKDIEPEQVVVSLKAKDILVGTSTSTPSGVRWFRQK